MAGTEFYSHQLRAAAGFAFANYRLDSSMSLVFAAASVDWCQNMQQGRGLELSKTLHKVTQCLSTYCI